MHIVTLAHAEDFEGWRSAARALAAAQVPSADIAWQIGDAASDLFAQRGSEPMHAATAAPFSVPRAFLTLAQSVIGHPDPERFDLLYRLLLRLRSKPRAMEEGNDTLIQRLERMAREARRQKFGKDMAVPALGDAEDAMAARTRQRAGSNVLAAWQGVRDDAKLCTRCHLYKHATQTVFGEGPLDAKILFVGEQPGDQEDLAGRPFVGPAGQIFDKALAEAGVDRSQTYVTNAVKHFKFEQRGKRRLHKKPEGPEIEACRWWIEQERLLIRPPLTVALGATAARSIFGKVVTISGMRGRPHQLEEGGEAWVTVHPSFLLRIPEEDRKKAEYARFVEDLARLKARLAEIGA
jgi:uracil-DNA glycosylase family protein